MVAGSMLSGCAASISCADAPPILALAPAALAAACPRPVALAEGALAAAEVEAHWLRDRQSLITCGDRLAALAAYYASRDARITRADAP